MTSVSLRGLTKHYDGFAAVRGIDLDIAEGEFVVFLGPSGCGKTTTLRCIAGLEDITDGQILLDGQVVSDRARSLPPERRRIGMVFQSYAVWPHMSVGENVAFGLRLNRFASHEIRDRVLKVLDTVGLAGFGDRDVSALSGGQQQRVALARAIALEPRVLLFDEPLSNLDAKLRERMRFELRQLQRRLGIASIYVTHDQQEAMVVADRIVLMNNGRIEQVGTPQELYRRPVSVFGADFLGAANVLPGKVIASGSTTRVELAGGIEIESADSGFAAGNVVDAVVRPENVSVLPAHEHAHDALPGTVRSTAFLGSILDLVVDVHGVSLRIQMSPPRAIDAGEHVLLRIPPEAVVLIARQART